jgi:apolipoprotein D and lipocalin family protein
MKFSSALFALSACASLTPLCNDAKSACDALDLSKYIGKWYEQGATFSIRNTIESGCSCVEANYRIKENGDVEVKNTCVKKGKIIEAIANASPKSKSEFKVVFTPDQPGGGLITVIQNASQSPNYLVKNVWMDQQGNYQRALVVAPRKTFPFGKNLDSIWVLSRTTTIPQAEIDEILAYATAAGYDIKAAQWKPTDQITCRK